MILARDIINAKLDAQNLLPVSYRISADYGRVEVATSTSSRTQDLFGSPMNICAKINSMAEPNGLVRRSISNHKILFLCQQQWV
jgi:class 3 adenylate cyclase